MYPRSAISRPGDGDRSPVFDLNFNRAELKIAECLQLLDKATTHHLFSKPVTVLLPSCQHCHLIPLIQHYSANLMSAILVVAAMLAVR